MGSGNTDTHTYDTRKYKISNKLYNIDVVRKAGPATPYTFMEKYTCGAFRLDAKSLGDTSRAQKSANR